jgi:hypothetical protein
MSNLDPERVKEVLRIRIDGAQLHDVIDYAAEKAWSATEEECAALIRAADNLLVRRQDRSRKRITARHIAQREALYARALNGADYGTSVRILGEIAKLQGLYDKSRENEQLIALAHAQAARIAELEALAEGRVIAIEGVADASAEDRPEEDVSRPEEDQNSGERQR